MQYELNKKKKKKKSSAAEATPSSSIASKQPRSNTSPSLRDCTPATDHPKYWGKRFVEEKKKRGDEINFDSIAYIFLEFISEIQKDYTQKCELQWSSVSVTTTVKEKTTPIFSPSFFLIG